MKPIRIYDAESEIPDRVTQVVYAEDQPAYEPLPVAKVPTGQLISRWRLNPEEIEIVTKTGEIYLCVNTFNQPLQPISLSVDRPEVSFDENGQPFFYSPLWWKEELVRLGEGGSVKQE